MGGLNGPESRLVRFDQSLAGQRTDQRAAVSMLCAERTQSAVEAVTEPTRILTITVQMAKSMWLKEQIGWILRSLMERKSRRNAGTGIVVTASKRTVMIMEAFAIKRNGDTAIVMTEALRTIRGIDETAVKKAAAATFEA